MKIFKLDKIPKEYAWSEPSEFDEYEIEYFIESNVQAIFYWYVYGGYEGSGQCLILKDAKWYLHDCGHCSCYGPTERLNLNEAISDSLDGIQEKCTDDLWKEVEPLVIMAKENYKFL